MTYEEEAYDHYHIVAICTECADIAVIAVVKDTEALTEFYDTLESGLRRAADLLPRDKRIEFETKVIVPNKILTIVPEGGHKFGHNVIGVTHKCTDPYRSCFEYLQASAMRKMAEELTKRFMSQKLEESPAITDNQEQEKNEQARRLIDSLELSDDLFKGFN
jgi:hypothetical protein